MRVTIKLLAALTMACSLPLAAASAQTPALPFTLKPIGPDVYAAIDGPENKSGSNAGFVIGDDGVLVIDSFQRPEAAKALLAEIRKLTPKPIRYVVNTHYHYDHVGGDAVFAEAGAVIIAHRNVHGWVREENPHLFGKITDAQKAAIDALPLPQVGVDNGITIWLGQRRVDVRYEKGHTGGDLVVAIPDAHVLFCGDLLWRQVSPNIIDGTVSQWIATETKFQKLPDAAQTTYVPGHGDVAKVADVADFQSYLVTLTDLTKAARKAKLSGDALVADVLPKLKAKFGKWQAFDYFATKEIGFMDDELAGKKRVPPLPK